MSGNVADRFAGMSKAEASTGRTPNPSLGKAAYLVSQVRMHDNTRKGGYRVEISATCLWEIEKGKTHDGKEAIPNQAGDKVATCFFSGDYFLKQFKEFCLKCIGKEPHEELEIADVMCPESDYPNTGELERLAIMWNQVLPGKVCAFDSEGANTDAGVFDGQVVLEIGTTEKKHYQKADKSKPDGDENRIYDKDGNALSSIFTNSFFNRKISMQEVGEKLDEDGIKRFFGSTENFMAILKNEG